MLSGDFKAMRHEHHFKSVANGTFMIDIFSFESPWGGIGKMVNRLYLTDYLRKLLEHRNGVVKEYAETDKWKFLLNR
jgi:ligand-binding SRPBCC domain-containing protein